jgi:stage II sporulation protein P
VARWRQPVVIWLRRARKNRYWQRKTRPAARVRVPWTSAVLYASVLALAAGVLWEVPPRPVLAPVSTAPAAVSKPSWLARTLGGWRVSNRTLEAWLNAGMPLLGLVMGRRNFNVHWGQLVSTGLNALTGVRLNSLSDLLQAEIPAMTSVPASAPPQAKPTPRPSHPKRPPSREQTAVDPALPGDDGHVWAVLGQDPQVGIYQTHSEETFWSELPKGATSPYSRVWSKNIVAVGWWLAKDLYATGTPVVQSRVDNMSEGLLASYNRAYYTAKKLIQWYPTVRLLIDLHRSPDRVVPHSFDGHLVARIQIIVGTNKLLPNEFWHQNLAVALKLAQALNQVSPGILVGNGVDTVPYRYNQELMAGDLMVEVGGVNNTLAEEQYAVRDLAEAIHRLIVSGGLNR